MNLTKLLRPIFQRRVRQTLVWASDTEAIQRKQLEWLVNRARNTIWGNEHNFNNINSYEDFAATVPITSYPQLRPYVMRMIAGEHNVLWPGLTTRFAQSSGTSDGQSKFIPVTADSLKHTHYHGTFDVVAHYLNLFPDSRIFSGRSLILGGSFANTLHLPTTGKVKVGDLSANLIDAMNPLAELLRVPSKKIALMPQWSQKLPALAEAAAKADITNISGVPSWFHTVLLKVLEITGASELHQVWPKLEVFFHGGISMKPYRELYDAIIDPSRMHYLETYNASEGFFAVQDRLQTGQMLLIIDSATFFEFIPLQSPDADPVPLWETEIGQTYSMLISSCNGLWRYPIGDTVRIESKNPVRISIAGRTKAFINAFGEEVMVYNTDAALTKACHETGARVLNYTAAPVFTSSQTHGRHQWLIEFETPPADLNRFEQILDRALQQENSDYAAKRTDSIFLDPLTVTVASPGLFDRWLASTGKLGGQRKVPRLANDRHIIDPLLNLNLPD